MIRRLLQQRLVRYLVVGGSAYVLEMSVLTYLRYGLDFSPRKSTAISFWFGFVVALILQKFVTFQNHETARHVVLRQTLAYSALVAFNYGFTLLVVTLLQHHLTVVVIRTLTIAIVTVWNFALYKKIFGESRGQAKDEAA